jgi:methylthioribulose-1-phosphate dehydratase
MNKSTNPIGKKSAASSKSSDAGPETAAADFDSAEIIRTSASNLDTGPDNDGSVLAGPDCREFKQQLQELCDCGRLFYARGWSVGTSSNYSLVIRSNPVDLLITASGEDKGNLSFGKFVRVGTGGLPAFPQQTKSSAETLLHVVLASRSGVGSILHTHSIWGTLLSDYFFSAGGFSISGYEMLKGLHGITTHEASVWVPIYENTQHIASLASLLEQDLADPNSRLTHGFLIRNHGLYTWGKDIASARRHVEVFEFLFEVLGRKTDFR